MAKILIVDDEPSMLEFLEIMLKKEGYNVTCSTSGKEAIDLCKKNLYDMVITDIKMPKVSGLDVLHHVKELSPETIVILITAYATMETAVQAMKEGAYDYISKPFKVAEIKMIIKNALEKKKQRKESTLLDTKESDRYRFGDVHLIGKSKEMMKVYDLIQKVSQTKSTVLIYGESGTGKELVARSIHNNSPRNNFPLVTINCGGIPETLLESELFGHKKGSFTGASHDKAGLFDAADRGTIFLDEVGDLPLPTQVKLLRVIQEKTFKPIGGTEEKMVDVRIISATNKDLEEMVIQREFREDLYYRLNVIQIRIPPLRERRDDIEILANYFLEEYSKELEKDIKEISSYAMEALLQYNFPGNVRELETIIERSVALETSNIVLPESLTLASYKEGRNKSNRRMHMEIPPDGLDLEEMMGDMEKDILLKALKRTHGSKKKAADLLRISFRSMRYKLEKYGIRDVE
ncbi:MAG: sigma-54 dependent transcriptional regulator [Thermodesulfobacteriota bacterium]|nr:sigma-54 dependent transcriptional regulator [Thermodesulfobacteriota bacterium]